MLQRLLDAAAAPDSTFEVAAVVTQPPRPTGRGNRKVPQPSPVQAAAAAAGLPADRILAPEKPGDPAFLAALRQLAPDLCITAAYGNYLPTSFLAVPPHGTLNIHPSLLPAYRGAAPVQRSLQDGVPISGVTVLYTVKAMDAGPILAQQKLPVGGGEPGHAYWVLGAAAVWERLCSWLGQAMVDRLDSAAISCTSVLKANQPCPAPPRQVDPDIQAPELLQRLFELGTDLLVRAVQCGGCCSEAALVCAEGLATHPAGRLRLLLIAPAAALYVCRSRTWRWCGRAWARWWRSSRCD